MTTIGDLGVGRMAPPFAVGQWYNAAPQTMDGLLAAGHPVLLDFWTATSPYMRRSLHWTRTLWEHYAPRGLTVVGVHTPEFSFDHQPVALAPTLDEFDVRWPILHDYQGQNWQVYGGRHWPRLVLIAQNGEIAADIHSEHMLPELVTAIDTELGKAPESPTRPGLQPHRHRLGRFCYPASPPIVFGVDSPHLASDVGGLEAGISLQGKWDIGPDYVSMVGDSTTLSAIVVGREHTAVLAPLPSTEDHELAVELNGAPVPDSVLGDDLVRRGRDTVVVLDRPRLYQLVNSERYPGAVRLTLRPRRGQVAVYRLTSNGCPAIG